MTSKPNGVHSCRVSQRGAIKGGLIRTRSGVGQGSLADYNSKMTSPSVMYRSLKTVSGCSERRTLLKPKFHYADFHGNRRRKLWNGNVTVKFRAFKPDRQLQSFYNHVAYVTTDRRAYGTVVVCRPPSSCNGCSLLAAGWLVALVGFRGDFYTNN